MDEVVRSIRAVNLQKERRSARRFPYSMHVEVGTQRGVGCDISRGGLAVYTREPVPIGEIVSVTLGSAPIEVGNLSGRARVLRAEEVPVGFRLALQFVQVP